MRIEELGDWTDIIAKAGEVYGKASKLYSKIPEPVKQVVSASFEKGRGKTEVKTTAQPSVRFSPAPAMVRGEEANYLPYIIGGGIGLVALLLILRR
jgi:hypothetical protein